MATTVIHNSAVAGAMAAITAQRSTGHSGTPTDYANQANIAAAFATQFLTANAALGAPMADADNAQIGPLCQEVVQGYMSNRTMRSVTAADYAAEATVAVAIAKEAAAKLT